MKLSTEIITSTPKELVYFEHLRMEIVPEGLEIQAKAPLFAPWIKTQCQQNDRGEVTTFTKPGVGKFYYPQESWAYTKPYGFAAYSAWQYFADDKPNLIWLFNVELEQGSTTKMKTPISLNNWEDYFTNCCRAIQEIYTRELRRAAIDARFKEILE